ncbi:MAG: hypothetical protein QOF49_618 [Chloroflexota bacterium]|jgi:hypothetical protein|nr:hypothetical protein [Chloroflexota bacterium]
MSSGELDETFAADRLDRTTWLPCYLPHWSSRADSAATYELRDHELHLTIPPAQAEWCAGRHDPPLRVSAIQTAGGSGPVGSTEGAQSFRPGLTVREAQPPFRGFTARYGDIEIRMRGVIGPRSMVAFWLSGLEEEPWQSGEICVAEIFGATVRDGFAEVGLGIKPFQDPTLREAFAVERVELDVSEFHTYAIDWRPGSLRFLIDGGEVRRLDQAPDYPLQLELGVFDFTATPAGDRDPAVPALIVSRIRAHSPATG